MNRKKITDDLMAIYRRCRADTFVVDPEGNLTGAIPETEAKKLIENGEAVLYSSYPIAIQRKGGRS